MSDSGLVKALCPIVGGRHCSWVNTLMKYVFSSFTLSSSVSVIEPSFFLDEELLLWFLVFLSHISKFFLDWF